MSVLAHIASSNTERLVRTAFWTLWVLTVAFTAYALAVETFGVGLFLRDQHAPKLHMRGEAYFANILSIAAVFGLAIASAFIGRWSRPLRYLGFAAITFGLFHLAIPRF
ncbi:MAG: hypothetical protein ACAH88_13885 [Roseimicrobium sp.]